jgi:hypothetical protein
MRSSSSAHSLNADLPMRRIDKIQYLVLNLLSNIFTKFRLDGVKVTKFQPSQDLVAVHVETLSGINSPSRIISNIFWEELDWDLIRKRLNGELRVIEVGCGTGRYGVKLRELAQIDSYRGIDIEASEEWGPNTLNNFQFEVGSYEDFLDLVFRENLIITQSALEHFEHDLLFFDFIKQYAETADYPVISIHLFPSPACLFTMLLHGIRQYNRRAIAHLAKVSSVSQSNQLYVLGGIRSNFLHFVELTLRSLVLRKPLATKSLNRYLHKVAAALGRDSASTSKFSPSFYALILSWNTEGGKDSWLTETKSSL